MRDSMPPPAQGGAAPGAAPAPAQEGGEEGGGDPQEMIQKIDQMLGALSKAAGPAGAALQAVRDQFQAAIEEMLAGAGGGKEPTAGPVSPEQGGAANVRPAGP